MQASSHAGVLRSLPGEQERELGTTFGEAPGDAVRLLGRVGYGAQALPQLVERSGANAEPIGQRRAASVCREANVREACVTGLKLPVASDELVEGCVALGSKRQDMNRTVRAVGGLRFPSGWSPFKNDVSVGAAEPERADSCDARRMIRPRAGLSGDLHRKTLPSDVGAGLFEVQVRRKLAMLEREDHLDDAGDSGCCLEMPEVRFCRADDERFGGRALAENSTQRAHLDRISERGSGTVRLHVANRIRLQARVA